jgi:hypothetical protein
VIRNKYRKLQGSPLIKGLIPIWVYPLLLENLARRLLEVSRIRFGNDYKTGKILFFLRQGKRCC